MHLPIRIVPLSETFSRYCCSARTLATVASKMIRICWFKTLAKNLPNSRTNSKYYGMLTVAIRLAIIYTISGRNVKNRWATSESTVIVLSVSMH